jgi:hypothetical protein
MGHAVAQWLRHYATKPEGRGFEIRWAEYIFPVYLILSAALGPRIYLAPNRNEYQKQKNNISVEWNVAGAKGWQPYRPLWADFLDNLGSQTSHNPIGLHSLLWG